MTLPTAYSWFPVGERLLVPYEASEGRRVNGIGLFFAHGPDAGRFLFETYAVVPKSRAKKPRKTLAEVAAQHGLSETEIATLDAGRVLAFIWKAAGRPAVFETGWKRLRPLVIALDNYSVHKSQVIQEALPLLEAADIYVLYLPAYSPELSEIEPVWNDVKYRKMTKRSYSLLGDLKQAVDDALQCKADELFAAYAKTEPFIQQAA
jgi:hypothetical protein